MRIYELIEHLKMFPGDMEVYIQTIPSDFASSLQRSKMSVLPAFIRDTSVLEQAKLVFTAHIPPQQ